jgi:acyl-CoA thioesterase-1
MVPCPLSATSLLKEAGLPRTATKLQGAQGLRIVALGSSTTEGTGATRSTLSYPSLLRTHLRRAYPKQSVTVLNKGVGGETAQQMEARLDRDVLAHQPDLVLWQTGTNDAIRNVPHEQMTAALDRGLKRLRALDIDVLLIGPQHSLPLEHRIANYHSYVESMRRFADGHDVAFLDRYQAMLRWNAQARPRTLLASDNLHLNDDGYRCLGKAVADAILCMSGGRCPEQ